ncbi:MAG: hypothetical protein JSW47_18215, partial [Phycisphaerales bacterium]
MRTKATHLLLAYVYIVSTGGAFAAGVEIEDGDRLGLIGHWKFDDPSEGLLRDSAELGLDASVSGGVLLETGVFGSAV